ncbi:MAG: HK97 family phage prohead protease [Clostridia bacterium]|nr:HK97 family phage prohead protease [Clostridia bacterium]
MKNQKELRMLPMTELRVNDEGGGVIEGHAAVFDLWSETLGGIFPFKERVSRGAFAESIMQDDIRALFNHDPNYVLGRNKAGTLELAEDDVGLRVRINPPDTSWARDIVTSIRRGDISQMSIGFIVEKDSWASEGGMDTRDLKKVRLFDVSPVTFPAYTQTDVGVRAMQSYNGYKEEQRKVAEEHENAARNAKNKAKINALKTKFKNI